MTDQAEVKLGADATDLQSVMAKASQDVSKSMNDISKSLDGFNSKHADVAAYAGEHNASILASFSELREGINSRVEGLAGAFESIIGLLGRFSGMIAGGFIGKEAVSELLSFEESVRKLEISFGMTAEKAAETNTALKLAGMSADQFQQMGIKVGRVLKTNSDEFDRLGVTIKDTSGNLLPMDEILKNIYTRMQDFKAGTDQDMFALSLVGRGSADFASDMERLGRASEIAQAKMKELGIELGPEHQAEIEEYRMQMNAFKLVVEEVFVKLGEQLLPGLLKLAEFFNSTGPAALKVFAEVFKDVLSAITYVENAVLSLGQEFAKFSGEMPGEASPVIQAVREIAAAFVEITYAVSVTVSEVIYTLEALARKAATVAAFIHDVFTLNNPFGKGSVFQSGLETEAQAFKEHNDKLNKMAQERLTTLKGIYGVTESEEKKHDQTHSKSVLPGSGNLTFTPKGQNGADTRMAAWRDELTNLQQAQGYFNEFSKTQEAEFWESKLAMVKGKGQEEVKLRQQLHQMIFQARKAAANEELQTDLAKWQAMSDAAKNDKETQIGIADARLATMKTIYGEDSKEYAKALDEKTKLLQQWVEKEAQINKTRTAISMQKAKADIEAARAEADQDLAMRRISAQQRFEIEKNLEDQVYELQLKALRDEQSLLDDRTNAWQQVEQKIEALEQTHQKNLTKISNDAEKDRSSFITESQNAVERGAGSFLYNLTTGTMSWKKAMLDALNQITQAISKLAADKIAQQMFGGGSSGNDMIGGIFGAIGNYFGMSAGGVGLTGSNVAVSGAMTQAGDYGLASAIASFDVGTPYVPQTGLALIHQGERIIPASQNFPGGYGNGPMSVNNHFNIQGQADAATQSQIASKAAWATQRAMRRNM